MHAAIVTGVSRGLGEALAAVMLARGFTVLGVGRAASPRLKSKRFHLAASAHFDFSGTKSFDQKTGLL